MKARERRRQSLVVASEPSKAGGPSKRALDHPASGQEDETTFGFFQFYHFQPHALLARLRGGNLSGVTLIDKGYLDFVAGRLLDGFDQVADLGALLFISQRDFHSQKVAERIDRDMDFETLAALVSVIAPAAAAFRGGLHGAAIQNDRRRLAGLARQQAQ